MILLKKSIAFFVFGNILIAFAALCLVFQSEILFFKFIKLQPYHFQVFFATLGVYNLHRLLGIRNSGANSLRSDWAKNNQPLLKTLLFVSIAGLLISTALSNYKNLFFLAPLLFISLAYSLPILSKGTKKVRIREINYIKTFIIAIVWTLVTVVVPLFHSEANILKSELLMVLTERFLFVLAITIPFDIRDAEEDFKKGILTLPGKIGEKKSKLYALLTLMCFFITLLIHRIYFNGISERLFLSFLISGFLTAILIAISKKNRSDYFFLFWLDGTLIIQSLLVLIMN